MNYTSVNESNFMESDNGKYQSWGHKDFCFFINVIVDGTLSISGIICNGLAFCAMQMDRHKLSMTILLQGLSLADGLFLVYTLLYTCLRSVYPYTGDLEAYHKCSPYIVALVLPLGWISQTCAVWLVTMVTIDRWLAIGHPFASTKYCTVKSATIVTVFVWICSVVFNSPRFAYYYHLSFKDNSTQYNSTFVANAQSHNAFLDSYRIVYHIGVTLAVLFIIPLPILMVLNAKLIRAIYIARRRQECLTGAKNSTDLTGVTVNLIVVVTIYIICQTPDFVATIITLDDINISKQKLEYFLCLKEMLLVFNASVNFLIYCLFYEKFRTLLKQLFCGHSQMCTDNKDLRHAFSYSQPKATRTTVL